MPSAKLLFVRTPEEILEKSPEWFNGEGAYLQEVHQYSQLQKIAWQRLTRNPYGGHRVVSQGHELRGFSTSEGASNHHAPPVGPADRSGRVDPGRGRRPLLYWVGASR